MEHVQLRKFYNFFTIRLSFNVVNLCFGDTSRETIWSISYGLTTFSFIKSYKHKRILNLRHMKITIILILRFYCKYHLYFIWLSTYNIMKMNFFFNKKRLLPHVTTYYQLCAESFENNYLSKLCEKLLNFASRKLKRIWLEKSILKLHQKQDYIFNITVLFASHWIL